MPDPITGPIPYNIGVHEHLLEVRADYLVPHINLEDLTKLPNLLSFIHYRGRLDPAYFCRFDNSLTYVGRHTRLLPGYFVGGRMFSFVQKGRCCLWQGYGSEPSVKEENVIEYRTFYHLGEMFGPTEACVMAQSQSLTVCFLKHLCMNILKSIPGRSFPLHFGRKPSEDQPSEDEVKATMAAAFQFIKDSKSTVDGNFWPDIVVADQFEPIPPTINVDRFASRFAVKKWQAETHLESLFDDPDYFADTVFERKEHHWCNLKQASQTHRYKEIENYDDAATRGSLLLDCIRGVLRRAFCEFFLWNAVDKALTAYNADLEAAYPIRSTGIVRIGNETLWGRPPLIVNAEDPAQRSDLPQKYIDLVVLVRYYAVFFVNEFRVHAIHAASRPMRDRFASHIRGVGKLKLGGKCIFPKQHMEGTPARLCSTVQTVGRASSEISKPIHMASELIDRFIACKMASTHVGMHKVTQRLQAYSQSTNEDDNEEENGCLTKLVADTVDNLGVLSELAEYLELQRPIVEYVSKLSMKEQKECFARAGQGNSIDFFSLDDNPLDDNVPAKRMKRIIKFLGELEGWNHDKDVTMPLVRGDLKRLGNSILKTSILPINAKQEYKISQEVLDHLQETMDVRVSDTKYDYQAKESTLDLGGLKRMGADDAEEIIMETSRANRGFADAWRAAAKARKEDTPDQLARSFDGVVLEHKVRKKLHEKRREREMMRCKRRSDRIRKKWKYTDRGVSRRDPVDVGDQMDEDEDEDGPKTPEPEMQKSGTMASEASPSQPNLTALQLDSPPRTRAQALRARLEQEQREETAQTEPAEPVPRRAPSRPPQRRVSGPAPDSAPRRPLPKRVWHTLETIFGEIDSPVKWGDILRAMNALGYEEMGSGSSHESFMWTSACRWQLSDVPKGKGKHLIIARNHEGVRKSAAPAKVRTWKHYLMRNGVTLQFIRKWYSRARTSKSEK